MKILKYINIAKNLLLYHPDLDLHTFKLMTSLYYDTLSKTQQERWKNDIDYLLNFSNTQQTLAKNMTIHNTKQLEKELNRIKTNENINRI